MSDAGGSPEPVRPLELRVSDAERHRVAEALREAAGEGRLEIGELEERLEAAYAAKTYADLVPITSDLPRSTATAGPVEPTGSTWATSFALMGECRRAGPWTIGEHHTAFALMGSVVLDLRQARFPAGEVVIDASAVMGSVEVVVDSSVDVRVDGVGVMGSYGEARSRVPAELRGDSPRVRVRGLALMGSVEARRKGPRARPGITGPR